jgi:2-polyprenyl-3-methyl-5-hydroxy-6-metoxy-1,4-benzoquinol methylase
MPGPSINQRSPDGQANFGCRLCEGRDLALYYTQGNDGRFRYYRCESCGLVNLDLSQGMDQSQCNLEFRDPKDEAAGWDHMLDATFAFIRRHVPDARSLCDIGCGNGRLLYLAAEAGWQVFGLELTEDIAERTADHLGVEITAGDFLAFDPPDRHREAWDVVCLRHVLEHLPDSKLALAKIAALLRPGGHALLEFPNIEALDKKLKRALTNAGLHRRRFANDFMPGHCNEFCRHSFVYLLGQTGFRLERWETYSKKPLANWIYNRLPIGNKARALIRKTG